MKTISTTLQRSCCATLIGLAAVTVQGATINGYYTNARFFNDMPGSTLTITPAAPIGENPATITIFDQFVGTGNNRHDVMASSDGGLTAHNHGIDDSFTFTTRLTLTAGFNSPRKEAGIRLNSPITGDMLFLVNSDNGAGEIVTFGGPFHLFGVGATGYTPGTSILLGITQIGGGDGIGGNPTTIEFFIDYGAAGLVTTGPLPWTNLEGGPLNYQVGVYAQGGNNTAGFAGIAPTGGSVNIAPPGDFIHALFTDTTYTTLVPEPGTFTLVGMGLFGLLAIRRKH